MDNRLAIYVDQIDKRRVELAVILGKKKITDDERVVAKAQYDILTKVSQDLKYVYKL